MSSVLSTHPLGQDDSGRQRVNVGQRSVNGPRPSLPRATPSVPVTLPIVWIDGSNGPVGVLDQFCAVCGSVREVVVKSDADAEPYRSWPCESCWGELAGSAVLQ